jgi:hypothetical protein
MPKISHDDLDEDKLQAIRVEIAKMPDSDPRKALLKEFDEIYAKVTAIDEEDPELADQLAKKFGRLLAKKFGRKKLGRLLRGE